MFESGEIPAKIADGVQVMLDLENGQLVTDDETYALPPLPEFAADIIKAGGITRYVKEYGRFPGEE